MVGPCGGHACGGHARKDGRTGFSSAAPAALQPLRWPHGVLKRCTCRASTFKMAVQGSQALRLPRFNLLDGRTGFSSAAPVTQTNGICKIIVQTRAQLNPPRCGENTILVLRARRFSTLLNAPRCGVRSILAGQLTF